MEKCLVSAGTVQGTSSTAMLSLCRSGTILCLRRKLELRTTGLLHLENSVSKVAAPVTQLSPSNQGLQKDPHLEWGGRFRSAVLEARVQG